MKNSQTTHRENGVVLEIDSNKQSRHDILVQELYLCVCVYVMYCACVCVCVCVHNSWCDADAVCCVVGRNIFDYGVSKWAWLRRGSTAGVESER